MELIAAELAGQREMFALSGGEQRLASEMTRLSLQNVDSDRLAGDVGRLVEYLVDYMHPAFELRYPTLLDQMSKDRKVLDRFAILVDLDFMRPVSTLSRDALDVAQTIKDQWDDTKLTAVGSASQPTFVALSFPKPGSTHKTMWTEADPTRSARVWSAVQDPAQQQLSLDIRPEDLYSAIGGASQLQCAEATPIIRSMGVYFTIENSALGDTLNDGNWRVPAQVDGRLLFTTSAGPKNYLLANGDWLTEQVGVLFGTGTSAVSTFKRLGAASLVANGLSPFTKYVLDVTQLKKKIAVLPDALELVVVLELERQKGNVRGVSTCLPKQQPPDPTPFSDNSTVLRRKQQRVLPNLVIRKRKWH
jgi:hypothetical protein